MYEHMPLDYVCPFCLLVRGVVNEHVYSRQSDIVFQDEIVTAFIGSHPWPRNLGHVLIIPNRHYENIFDLPLPEATAIHHAARNVALAMKRAYNCDGISRRQHNEPAGNQDVWYYHMHVFSRFNGDGLYTTSPSGMPAETRGAYATRLRHVLGHHNEL